MKRTPLIAGNWKLNKNIAETREFLSALQKALPADKAVDVMIIPPFTSLQTARELLASQSAIELGAQDLSQFKSGAYTGEISAEMLIELGVKFVLVGHSERREIFQENDSVINAKVLRALEAGLKVVLCCGESLQTREESKTDAWVTRQIELALENVSDLANVVIAYEPIWAIGTGKTCSSVEANRVIKLIREKITAMYGFSAGNQIRILYGGSVKASTIEEQMAQPDIDGALVGGASLIVEEFANIVKGAQAKVSA